MVPATRRSGRNEGTGNGVPPGAPMPVQAGVGAGDRLLPLAEGSFTPMAGTELGRQCDGGRVERAPGRAEER